VRTINEVSRELLNWVHSVDATRRYPSRQAGSHDLYLYTPQTHFSSRLASIATWGFVSIVKNEAG
jgi:hypothetical protein